MAAIDAIGPTSKAVDTGPKWAESDTRGRFGTIAPDLAGVVETALARALDAAVTAGRFDLVAQIASELSARRVAREGAPPAEVVDLAERRAAR